MEKRTCVVIDDDIDKKLRSYQAKLINQKSKSISYSKTINILLREFFEIN